MGVLSTRVCVKTFIEVSQVSGGFPVRTRGLILEERGIVQNL